MRLGWSTLGKATLLILMVFTVGCGGINTTGSVNPLMFLLPGLGQTGPGPDEQPAMPEALEPIQIANTR
jgi:hypothetical protein